MRGHIIIMAPGFDRSLKIRVSRLVQAVVAIPTLALVLSIVFMAVTFPNEIQESDYSRVREENQALHTAKENAVVEAGRITTSIARMERLSSRISAEISSD